MVPSGTLFWPENQIAAPSSAYKVLGPAEAPITTQSTGGSDHEVVSQDYYISFSPQSSKISTIGPILLVKKQDPEK